LATAKKAGKRVESLDEEGPKRMGHGRKEAERKGKPPTNLDIR